VGIGLLGVSFAFGLTVLTMAHAVGHISGGHFNPAVTLGLWAAGRCANKHVLPYIVALVIGAIVAAGVLWVIASGKPGWIPAGFAANGYGDLSPGKYSLTACLITELIMTFFSALAGVARWRDGRNRRQRLRTGRPGELWGANGRRRDRSPLPRDHCRSPLARHGVNGHRRQAG
jgi:glycerol uptake facilitator-like aquaporin